MYNYKNDIEYINNQYYYELVLQLTEKGYQTRCNNGFLIYSKTSHFIYISTVLEYCSHL